MEPGERNAEELLLDWHLEKLDEDDRSWLEGVLRRDAELRAKSDRIGEILRPLDHWAVTPAPPNLAEKVLRHVKRAASLTRRSPLGGAVDTHLSRKLQLARTFARAEAPRLNPRGRTALRDLVAVAACLVLLMGVLLPGIRSQSQRALCASNLSAVYEGTRLYQSTFDGSLPFAGGVAGASWLPSGPMERPYASNSRHAYLLVKLGYGLRPERFVCPASNEAVPMNVDDPRAFDDFTVAQNITYSLLNLTGDKPNLKPRPSLAYMSDANPLFEYGRFNASIDPDEANSPTHDRDGQEVLTLDGRVTWETSPIDGRRGDNLWLAGDIRRYNGTETPKDANDAFLIPGYPNPGDDIQGPTGN